PSPNRYFLALELLGVSASDTLAVGDRLDTDILGGHRAGCRTALVLSGVTTAQAANSWEPKPDLIANDLTELVNMI
ncbi:haloacid dehalogenase, partial [bacterium]